MDSLVKIALLNNLYPPRELGGGGRSTQILAETLRDRGHEVTVLTLTPDERDVQRMNGVTVRRIPIGNLYWPFTARGHPRFMRPLFNFVDRSNPLMGKRVRDVLDEVQPDVVRTKNLYGFSTSVWKAVNDFECPLVHTLGDYYLICLHASLVRNGEVCGDQCWDCAGWTSHQARRSEGVDAVVGVSQFVLDKHRDFGYFPNSQRAVIPPPIRKPDTVEANKAREVGTLTVGYLGRLVRAKGLVVLLDAIKGLDPSRYQLLVAGEGPDHFVDEMKKKAPDPVQFLGYVEADTFFPKIDVLVVPSMIPETFGRVVVEAYQQDVPVIVSNRGALPEWVGPETEWVTPAGDVEKLRERLRGLMETPDRLEEGKNRGADLVRRTRPDCVAARYEELFESLVRATPGNRGPDR